MLRPLSVSPNVHPFGVFAANSLMVAFVFDQKFLVGSQLEVSIEGIVFHLHVRTEPSQFST